MFLFDGLSPSNKKLISLRPQRLRGENPNLDKSEILAEKVTAKGINPAFVIRCIPSEISVYSVIGKMLGYR
jgi:hypothetical protein